ncbi:hypothetical protein, partial [Paenibacillus sp. P22]|uniref:hypothetical protein n=1 Tax=Paenibacillus sp. P22 TaxID=483908 RepID=UPI001E4821ED
MTLETFIRTFPSRPLTWDRYSLSVQVNVFGKPAAYAKPWAAGFGRLGSQNAGRRRIQRQKCRT